MVSRREAILNGVARASDLHARLGIRNALVHGDGAVDVLAALQAVGLFTMFRPLEGLLGAYVPTRALSGVLVTTKRDLHIQRFTAAHELGHHILGHRTLSLDREIGFVGRGESSKYDPQEIEADAFAAEFLLPRWLIAAHLRRQQWGRKQLLQPEIAYQLSLRLGTSYSATCWALLSQDFLNRQAVDTLLSVEPKIAKQSALPDVEPEDWYRDVLVVSEKDRGSHIIGSPNDFIIVALEEHVAGGYSWDAKGVDQAGLTLEKDGRISPTPNLIGGSVRRRLVMQGTGNRHLHLEERRAWDKSQPSRSTFDIDFVLIGREPGGIPRFGRRLAA